MGVVASEGYRESRGNEKKAYRFGTPLNKAFHYFNSARVGLPSVAKRAQSLTIKRKLKLQP